MQEGNPGGLGMSDRQHQGPLLRADNRELAARAGAGDREAVGKSVVRYAGRVRRLAPDILGNPEDADDAARAGFRSAVRALARRRRRDANDG
jgi:DNA-directed RNA polymerase specialized sigma24 family protein